MATTVRDDDDAMVSGINVTPLVDITLVLLIIFMVTARLIDGRAIEMKLPPADKTSAVQSPFTVALHAGGGATVNGAEVASDEAVLGLARDARRGDPEIKAVIHADTTVQHGRVIHVLDLLKQADVNRIAFGVAQAPSKSAPPKEERNAP